MILSVICSLLLSLGFHNVLPESGNVFSIAQDNELNMWFGTNTGFYRYDGANGHKYPFNFQYPVADANRFYQTGVYCDETGGVWVLYKNLYKFDSSSSSFVQVDGVSMEGATDIIDFNGMILVACNSEIIAIDRETLSVVDVPEGLRNLSAYRFYCSGHGILVITKDYKLLRYNLSAKQATAMYDLSFFRNRPLDIAEKDGCVWISSDGGGIASINELGECKIYKHTDDKNSICSDYVRSIAFDAEGNLWAATGSGLSVMDKYHKFTTYLPNYEYKWSLTKKSLIKVFKDSDGGMWVGSVGGGVDYCCSVGSPFTTVNLGNDFKDIIGPIAEDSDGSIWIGTSRSGVYHYDPLTGTSKHFLISSSSELNDVKCIHFSRDGKYIYFGLAINELAVLSRKTGRITVSLPFSLSLTINGMVEDGKGDLWLGTSDGIYFYDRETGKAVRASGQPSSLYVISLFQYAGDSCYVCVFDNLYTCRLSSDEGKNPRVVDLKKYEVVRSARCVCSGGSDEMLFCSENGITSVKEGKSFTFNADAGLSSNIAVSAIKDGNGVIWAGTKNGLNMIDEKSGVIKRFYDFDNLPSNCFSENSCMCHSDGTMYFGTVDGLVMFDPDALDYKSPSHKPYVTSVMVFGKEVEPDDGIFYIDPGASFSVFYGVNNYSSFDRNVFFYKMQPWNQSWIKTDHVKSVNFSKLKPGKYIFSLKSENAYGDLSESESETVIIIRPFWYQSILARCIFLAILLLAIACCVVKTVKATQQHYAQKIKKVEELSAETILENRARAMSLHYLSGEEMALLTKTITLIQNNMQDSSFSVEKLADDMCMSRSNLHRKIKSMTGLSTNDLLQRSRMEKAADLISHTDISIEEISETVGYSSSSYFIQAFKKFYNTTPGKLRQK